MKIWDNPRPTPVRYDLGDPRSSRASSGSPIRKTLLNDRRSTR
jgi:hypothetical protein